MEGVPKHQALIEDFERKIRILEGVMDEVDPIKILVGEGVDGLNVGERLGRVDLGGILEGLPPFICLGRERYLRDEISEFLGRGGGGSRRFSRRWASRGQ